MKLWIAAFFSREDSEHRGNAAFLMRAPDVSECARVAEEYIETHPILLGPDLDRRVSAVVDLLQDAPGPDACVLHGPREDICRSSDDHVYWRRDEGDAFWINTNRLYDSPFEEFVYYDPRGWPHYRA